jgi:hypothetical protein
MKSNTFPNYCNLPLNISSNCNNSSLNLDLRDVLPRHDHQTHESLLHVDFHIPTLASFLMSLSREFDIRSRGLSVLVCHREDNVALWIGAFHLSREHAAIGGVQVEGAVQEG